MSFSSDSILPTPWLSTTFFFYGSLQDQDVLRAVLKSDTQPVLQKAVIKGWKLKRWGQYPTVIIGDDEVNGMAFEVHTSEQYERLAQYETSHYTPSACRIFIEGMRMPVKGITFRWSSDSHNELSEGTFDLEHYQKNFKPSWAKSLDQPQKTTNLYFAYGSNWAKIQMDRRCPDNTLLGIAVLTDYIWIINHRGYANVVPKDGSEVWGIVYRLSAGDEEKLDKCEGVPYCYQKQILPLHMKTTTGNSGVSVDAIDEALVYVDSKDTSPGTPRKEYVTRMNMGIDDAIKQGIPQEWIDKVVRPFIPPLQTGKPSEHADPFLNN